MSDIIVENINRKLDEGTAVQTTLDPQTVKRRSEEYDEYTGRLTLEPGDHLCESCHEPITGYRNANHGETLARIKVIYGATYCPSCKDDISE